MPIGHFDLLQEHKKELTSVKQINTNEPWKRPIYNFEFITAEEAEKELDWPDQRDWLVEQAMLPTYKEMRKHRAFLTIVHELAELSHCVSKQVASIAVKDSRIIASGINGSPKGFCNCDDKFQAPLLGQLRKEHHEFSDKYEVHAEQNLLVLAAREGLSLEGSTIYCTLSPCLMCAKLLVSIPVKAVYYIDEYDLVENKNEIKEFFKTFRIQYEQISMPELKAK